MNTKKIIKILALILALLIFSIVAVYAAYSIRHELIWKNYYAAKTEAVSNGYDDEYSVCTKENDVLAHGVKYSCYRAYRKMILDSDYVEYILVSPEDEYKDISEGDESLIVFGKKLDYIEAEDGKHYTLIDAYSVEDFPTANENALFKLVIIYSLICAAVVLLLFILLIILIICYRRKIKNSD